MKNRLSGIEMDHFSQALDKFNFTNGAKISEGGDFNNGFALP